MEEADDNACYNSQYKTVLWYHYYVGKAKRQYRANSNANTQRKLEPKSICKITGK